MKIVIIGGGPAGMMAAYFASRSGKAQVTLLEKNEKLGKKLFITGKGRCNLCNDSDREEIFEHIVHNSRFLYSAYDFLSKDDLMALFEKWGVPLKTERGNRVFPQSDKSSDIIRALERALRKNGVEIRLNTKVQEVDLAEKTVRTSQGAEAFDLCCIATGGFTYPATGSTGDGYAFAEETGHRLVAPVPALVGLRCHHVAREELMGLSLKNILLKARDKKSKWKKEVFGELLFTHYGISGPTALTLSSYINRREVRLSLDLKPALSEGQLEERILREIQRAPNRENGYLISLMEPGSLVAPILELAGLEQHQKLHQMTKAQRRRLIEVMKNFPLEYQGLFERETGIVTSGGVHVKDVNPSTMASRRAPQLYFAGEVLDLDGETGGYNLQIAFSTGALAGKSMEERLV